MRPNDILYTTLGKVAHVTMGQAPPGSTYNEEKSGLPLIAGAGDLGNIYPQPKRWTTNPLQTCLTGDIIICVRATIGIMNWADRIYCLGRGVASIRANENLIEPEYLYYSLTTNVDNLTKVASGSTFIQIKRQDIEDLQIPLPPLPEQRRIAAILREADEIRKLRQQANEKTQKIVESLFYDMFGDPLSWKETLPLQNCVNFVGGGTPNTKVKEYFQGDIPWATSKDIKKRYLYDTQDHITEEAIQHSSTKLVPTNTILVVVKSKILMHSLPMSIVTRPVCFGQDIKGLVCKPNFEPQFIVASLATQKDRILGSARGVNTEGLTLELLRNIPIPQIKEHLQKRFVELVKIHDDLLFDYKETQLYTNVIYQSLLAQAFSGELTASWRESHHAELAQAAEERDRLLKGLDEATKAPTPQPPDQSEITNRTELTKGLTRVQTALLALIEGQRDTYFTASRVHEDIWLHIDEQGMYQEELDRKGRYTMFAGLDCSLDTIRRELHFLARMGLVKELTLPVEEESGVGIVHYITAYRSLRMDDDCQQQDLGLLNADLVEEARA